MNQSPGVVAYNSSKTKSVLSDLQGKIILDSFDSSEIIIFQHISYNKLRMVKSKISKTVYLKNHSQDLDEIVISASKFEQSKREVPQKIISIKSDDIILANPQTSADLLEF